MAQNPLTRHQRRLVRELDGIIERLRMNHREIESCRPSERTAGLNLIRDHLVRGEIVRSYTLVDEFLNVILCNHFFGRKRSHIKLWKTKRFKNFNYFFLEKLSLMEKLAYVRAIREVPRSIRQDVERLNNLRNGIAHSFFPENLRSAKPKWKGVDIFSLDGVNRFEDDIAGIDDYFVRRAFGG